MRAAWYDRQGPATDVLLVGNLPLPEPAAGEIRVRLQFSGMNPGDVKKRQGWLGSAMPYPRVVPHSGRFAGGAARPPGRRHRHRHRASRAAVLAVAVHQRQPPLARK